MTTKLSEVSHNPKGKITMRISLKIESRGVTVKTPGEGFFAAFDTITALTKIGYWGDLYNREAISSLRKGACREDPELRIAGAIRNGDRTAFHISYSGDFMHIGDWILRINVSKKKQPFAFVDVHFDRDSGAVEKVISHLLPPADQAQWRL